MGYLFTILALALIIAFHEFGHLICAKLCGIHPYRYSIGFGKVIFSKHYKGTEYCISQIPLGGYVMLENPETAGSMVTSEINDDNFQAQPAWKRLLIYAAGPAFNVLLSFLLVALAGIYFGIPLPSTKVGAVDPDLPAAKAGMRAGDRIIQVDGQDVTNFNQIVGAVRKDVEQKVLTIIVVRQDEQLTLFVIPDISGGVPRIGVTSDQNPPLTRAPNKITLTALKIVRFQVSATAIGLKDLFTGKLSFRKNVSSPIGIVKIGDQIYKEAGGFALVEAISGISIGIGILNILPIPLLDGGHILFIFIEIIRRKPLSKEVRINTLIFFFWALISLMVFVLLNDLGVIDWVEKTLKIISDNK